MLGVRGLANVFPPAPLLISALNYVAASRSDFCVGFGSRLAPERLGSSAKKWLLRSAFDSRLRKRSGTTILGGVIIAVGLAHFLGGRDESPRPVSA